MQKTHICVIQIESIFLALGSDSRSLFIPVSRIHSVYLLLWIVRSNDWSIFFSFKIKKKNCTKFVPPRKKNKGYKNRKLFWEILKTTKMDSQFFFVLEVSSVVSWMLAFVIFYPWYLTYNRFYKKQPIINYLLVIIN